MAEYTAATEAELLEQGGWEIYAERRAIEVEAGKLHAESMAAQRKAGIGRSAAFKEADDIANGYRRQAWAALREEYADRPHLLDFIP